MIKKYDWSKTFFLRVIVGAKDGRFKIHRKLMNVI
jgi:hypothetical protein